jgi:ketosteroid isomerase-like protein
MRTLILLLSVLVVVTGAFPGSPAEQLQQPTVTLPAPLARVLADYEVAWQNKDATALAFATEDSLGYIIGGFARQRGQPDTGKFTLTLRKGPEGRWLIMSDMDNGNTRP